MMERMGKCGFYTVFTEKLLHIKQFVLFVSIRDTFMDTQCGLANAVTVKLEKRETNVLNATKDKQMDCMDVSFAKTLQSNKMLSDTPA